MRGMTKENKIIEVPHKIIEREDGVSVVISKDFDFSSVHRVEVDYLGEIATNTDDGYLLLPRGVEGNPDYTILFFDRHKKDFENAIKESNMPVFGVKKGDRAVLAVVSGMQFNYTLNVELKDGVYRAYPMFNIDGEQPYEDIQIDFYNLFGDDANYSGMARRYRKLKLDRGEIIPLRDRMKNNEVLKYTAESLMIRIRCGWKPAPPEVLHQTPENEPEMIVACDFDHISMLLDELKAQGVNKAEICLVGWNVKGHDGRWPQTFPVCEELGGEEKLREVIKKGQDMGYQMVCHTNSTDQYEIADIYDRENSQFDKEGKAVVNPCPWSGGEMLNLCPKVALDQAKKILPQVRELGFKGTHYIDVLSIVYPRKCYHKDHFLNSKEAVEYGAELCKLTKDIFGGMSSEGGYDFSCPNIDYGLYISFYNGEDKIMDKSVPFWHLVYHGTVLDNPYTYTVNPNFGTKKAQLKLIEYGSRPAYYFYSRFKSDGTNWMGTKDARCGNPEETRESVAKIKKSYDEYNQLHRLNLVFMEDHREVAENVFETRYSDGTVIRVDYNSETYEIK